MKLASIYSFLLLTLLASMAQATPSDLAAKLVKAARTSQEAAGRLRARVPYIKISEPVRKAIDRGRPQGRDDEGIEHYLQDL